jgi:hypothetical protein
MVAPQSKLLPAGGIVLRGNRQEYDACDTSLPTDAETVSYLNGTLQCSTTLSGSQDFENPGSLDEK